MHDEDLVFTVKIDVIYILIVRKTYNAKYSMGP